MKTKAKHSFFRRAAIALLTVLMAFAGAQTARAQEVGDITINESTNSRTKGKHVGCMVSVKSSTTNATTTWVDFIGILSPEVIYEDGDEKHNLYLGEDNGLYWPAPLQH